MTDSKPNFIPNFNADQRRAFPVRSLPQYSEEEQVQAGGDAEKQSLGFDGFEERELPDSDS